MTDNLVIIAGGGIGGLTAALTLNQIGVRCGGTFDTIDDVVPPAERAEFMAGYKRAAGVAIESLNQAAPTIAYGARVASAAPLSV